MITDQKHLDSKHLGMKRKLLISAQAGYQICSKTKVLLNASYLVVVAYECSFDVGMRRRPPRCGSSIVKSLPNAANRKSIKFLHLSEISNPNIGETLNKKRKEEGLVAFDNDDGDDDDDDDATASNRMHL
ncbi:hypothetical protein T05_2046 [Trichinella murrelli]|uniref:Uncharacterized protein n=1 Tax=Trichinella murrelli TaxID=144512 RepID=A0A0V0TU64_9BILA|nr:hypothetical protein T05_2046 [Trichinella murrelli]